MCKLQSRNRNIYGFGLLKFFRQILINTPDSDIGQLSDSYESAIKNLKHEVYKLSWFMRGGVDAVKLLNDSDLEDLEILSKIVQENIETSKKTGTPMI